MKAIFEKRVSQPVFKSHNIAEITGENVPPIVTTHSIVTYCVFGIPVYQSGKIEIRTKKIIP